MPYRPPAHHSDALTGQPERSARAKVAPRPPLGPAIAVTPHRDIAPVRRRGAAACPWSSWPLPAGSRTIEDHGVHTTGMKYVTCR